MEQERLQEQLMQRQQRHQKLQQELALQQHKLQQEKDLNEQQVQLQQKLLRQQEQLLQQQKLQQKELQQLDSSIVQIPLYQGLQISPQVLQLIQQSRNVLAPQQNGQFPTPVAVQPQQHAPILEGPTNPDDFTEETIERDSKLTTVELIAQYHYPVETHYVTTGDGYVLCLHRIPRPDSQPILLVHGLMSSSASWVQMGPRNGLAYILFRRGYDVWMLNTRGNVYSKKHSNPRIKPSSYWSFSFHEIGKFDLPATIDFILNTTGLAKVQYIGHSQGCTAFFVMCSERRGYAKKISLMQALSPTTYMKHTRSPVLQFLSLFKHRFTVMLNLLGGFQLSLNTHLIRLFRKDICNEKTSPICSVFDFIVCGFDWKQFNETLAPLVLGHVSQGASTKQIYHYAQLHGVKKFQQFDHGSTANLQIYRQMTPPTYNLSAVTCKVALHYGSNDWLSSEKDVNRLYSNLPNCIENRQIDFPQFSHYDFTISKDVRPLVYNRVCDLVKQYAYVG
ncbi:lipase 1-like [Scaptodrosophila lebanonensis]|uniref:Lipase 1-like n=1 Tax=Drosophila lebanonensis TaxID=7225 RepID=A0A6J2U4I2_DROLE|nr:lipase 1-like [Scaptodrosophila lebanonensis]